MRKLCRPITTFASVTVRRNIIPVSARRNRTYLALASLMLLGLALRGHVLWETSCGIESDEAIVGLMARHMTEGASWPVFYYGQYYMGSLEPLLVAAMFKIFGPSNCALKLVPLIFSLFHIVLVFFLARAMLSFSAAYVAGLLTALGPSALILWSSKARGGFIEMLVLGTIGLLLCVWLLAGRTSLVRVFLLGFVLGLGWWVNNQIIFYMFPIAVVLGLYWIKSVGFIKCSFLALLGVVSFFIGGFPFWYVNLSNQPPWPSFAVLGKRSNVLEFVQHLEGFFRDALPIIFGARRFWSGTNIHPWLTSFAYWVYGLSFLLAVFVWARSLEKMREERFEYRVFSYGLILLFICCVPLIFSASSFGWLSKAPRYLLPLYCALPVLLAVVYQHISYFGLLGRLFATLLVCSVLVLNLLSSYWGGIAIAGEPLVYKRQRVQRNHQPLYQWLRQQGYSHVKTNYWIGYRLAFETDEEIIFSVYRGPGVSRIPAYEQQEPEFRENVPLVLVPLQGEALAKELSERGFHFRRSLIGGYEIIDHIRPSADSHHKINVDLRNINASSNLDLVDNLFDGDLGTRWGSGSPQAPGMFLEFEFAQLTELSGLELEFSFWRSDVPKHLHSFAERMKTASGV